MNSEIPIVEVYESEQTYEMVSEMYNKMLKEDMRPNNKPTSPLQRLLVDIFGFVALNAITFLVTDIIRGAATGKRPPVWWFWYGPWYWLTGAPLINNIVTMRRFFKELKNRDRDPQIKPTDEEKQQHAQRCAADNTNNRMDCCRDNDGSGSFDQNGIFHCSFSGMRASSHQKDYQQCVAKANQLMDYCNSFATDELYDRAIKMHDEHRYLFDLFYLFNYGSLPPGDSIWDLLNPF